jgi:hypothetical protein
MSETMEMPLTWPERLEKLAVGEGELIGELDAKSTASMAAIRLRKATGRQFKIRKNRITGETRVWRIK